MRNSVGVYPPGSTQVSGGHPLQKFFPFFPIFLDKSQMLKTVKNSLKGVKLIYVNMYIFLHKYEL